MKKLQGRLVTFFTEVGMYKEIANQSKKRRKFTPLGGGDHFLWIGKAGSVRKGLSYATSISISSAAKSRMEKWEKENE